MSEEQYRKKFGKRLSYYMSINGKNQMDLMNDLSLSSSTISSWCNGVRLPRMEKIEMLANYFGIEPSDLLNNKEISSEEYYLNPKTKQMAQEIFENKDLTLLFDAARDASPEDLQTVHTMLLALKSKERRD